MKRLFTGGFVLCTLLSLGTTFFSPAPAHSASISTLFSANNWGTAGGAVYFDLTTQNNDLTVTGFETNVRNLTTGSTFGFKVYTTPGTSFGNQNNAGVWNLVATGVGTDAGSNLPSPITLNNTFQLVANTAYGMAIVLNGPEGSAQHNYTNGTGSNQSYSNSDLTLAFGSATNTPFTVPLFTPRVWNGTISYELSNQSSDPVPEPSTIILLGTGLASIMVWRKKASA